MNTSYRNINNQYRSLNRQAPVDQAFRFDRGRTGSSSCCGGGHRYQAFRPGYNSSQTGIYNQRDLMRAVRGGNGSQGCCGSHRVGQPNRQQRRNRLNNRLTQTFNRFTERFPQGENAVGRLAGDKSRSTLVDLLGKNDLVGAVQGLEKKGPVTILAPSNKAFADLAKKQPELFKKLTDPRNKKALQDVLLYHVSNKRTDFQQGGQFDSLLPKDGAQFFGSPFKGTLINGNQRINTGLSSASANGSVVIPVDQVLIPPGFDPSKLL